MMNVSERYSQTFVLTRIKRHVICKMQKDFVELMDVS
jgi:hypothetical protein